MDGTIANLKGICELAKKYDALTMIDDAHAAGFLGKTGRGTHEYCGVVGEIDIITGTLGKALGGASGGYTSARKGIVDLLRQRSRPYLFSNTIAPPVVAASLKALELLSASTELRDKLETNTKYFRAALTERGLTIKPGTHPIVPIMLGDAALSQRFAARMLEKGVYVIGFFYPVVPHGTARVRTQVSAAHSREDLEFAVNAFAETNEEIERLAMLYMVVEKFKDIRAVYKRFHEKGRMMPDGLKYISSWIDQRPQNLLAGNGNRRRTIVSSVDRCLERPDGF